jgi:hypothetical protein
MGWMSGRRKAAGRGCGATRIARLRAAWLAALTVGALALGSSMAQATSVTDFSTFQNGGPSVPTMGWPFGIQVTYSGQLYWADHGEVYEETGGRRVTLESWCGGSGCVLGAVQPVASRDYAHPPTRTFEVVLYTDRNVPYGNTTLTVHERRLHFALEGDFDSSPGVFYVRVPGSLGNTTLDTVIYENGREVARCNVYWSHCQSPSVTSGAVYYADVEDPDGNLYGITPSYLATSSTTGTKETADNVDLVRLGALYATTTDVCDTLLTYPYGTHVENESPTDQWLACDTAVQNRSSMWDLLRAVALAGGGTRVLWWLEHQRTIQVLSPDWPTTPWPDDEVPAISDLPQVWQGAVMNIADHYMLQASGTDLTQAAAETIAAACLWNASRITNARSDCASVPVFVTGSDVAEATDHDLEAIAGLNGVTPHPEWVKLNYEASGAKNGSHTWVNSVSPCDGDTPSGKQCDEYPFWASEQGGPLARPTPHLRYIDASDNQLQGTRYSTFIGYCGLRTGTPQEGANATGGTAFLVVPLPSALGIPSYMRLCNR